MSDTDIYKNREPIPMGKKVPKKKRRRSSSRRAFDDQSGRKRRSKNSGLRRGIHLFRKSENEKAIWILFSVLIVLVLVSVGVWQFFLSEILIREQQAADNAVEYQPKIPAAGEEDTRKFGREPLIR
ncbi:MAG: hypothetical protein V5783_03290 [Pontiella sp.]